jgi:hypothetical protein
MIHFLESLGFLLSKGHFSKYEVRANADLGIEIVGFYSENVISSSEGTVDPIDIVGYKFDRAKGLHCFIVRTARIRGKD